MNDEERKQLAETHVWVKEIRQEVIKINGRVSKVEKKAAKNDIDHAVLNARPSPVKWLVIIGTVITLINAVLNLGLR